MREPNSALGPMRLPFLVLPPACVLLGAATAIWTTGAVNPLHFALALVGALAAHVSVNALNECHDFRSGLDMRTQPTPFSGGSGTLPARPEAAGSALTIGLMSLALVSAIGVFFLTVWGLGLLPLGLLGLLLIVAYTPWITKYPFLCLLAPGVGFGLLMVMGTDFVLTGTYGWTSFVASLVPTFLVSDLLLLNQFPDVEADQTVGRRHLPIVVGRRISSILYAILLVLAYSSIIVGVGLGLLPAASLLGLLTIIVAVPLVFGVYRHGEQPAQLVRYMGLNVLVTVTTPVLVAVGFLLEA